MQEMKSGGAPIRHLKTGVTESFVLGVLLFVALGTGLRGQTPHDPGLRGGTPGAGTFVGGMIPAQTAEIPDFQAAFNRVVAVPLTVDPRLGVRTVGGLGPRFNSNSCPSCHAQPAIGGSSPAANPLFSVYQLKGATNTMPSFITKSGPVLNARFPYQSDLKTPDGHIHQLFTIAGRTDAASCNIAQPNFATAQAQSNLVFRQPIPLFGDGMIDTIQDQVIIANMNSNVSAKQALGISGHPNIDNNDGAVTKFGWKAQVRSLKLMCALEQQVQKGVTNELFPNEMDETPGCVLNGALEDSSNYNVTTTANPAKDQFVGDWQLSTLFARFLDQPTPNTIVGPTTNGWVQFNNVGCAYCHNQTFVTANSTYLNNDIAVNLFSDLLVHHMGPCLADNIVQGSAQGDEFRTAPLWNVGQRIFFLHDGRTTDLLQAIEDHYCLGNATYGPSEANGVINAFNALSASNKQDMLYFLRNL